MKLLVIALIAVLIVAAIGVTVMALSNTNVTKPAEQKTSDCSSCGGKCTQNGNCGLSSCAALSGKPCNCGAR
jgi:hypothetical protein